MSNKATYLVKEAGVVIRNQVLDIGDEIELTEMEADLYKDVIELIEEPKSPAE